MVIFSQQWNGDSFWKFLTVTIDGFWWHQPMVYHATNGLQWFTNGFANGFASVEPSPFNVFWVLWPLPTMVYRWFTMVYQWLINGLPMVRDHWSNNGIVSMDCTGLRSNFRNLYSPQNSRYLCLLLVSLLKIFVMRWEHSNEQGRKVEVSLEFTWSQTHIES